MKPLFLGIAEVQALTKTTPSKMQFHKSGLTRNGRHAVYLLWNIFSRWLHRYALLGHGIIVCVDAGQPLSTVV